MGGDSYLGQTTGHLVGPAGGDALRPIQVRAGVDGGGGYGDRSWLKGCHELHLPSKGTDRRAVLVAAGSVIFVAVAVHRRRRRWRREVAAEGGSYGVGLSTGGGGDYDGMSVGGGLPRGKRKGECVTGGRVRIDQGEDSAWRPHVSVPTQTRLKFGPDLGFRG